MAARGHSKEARLEDSLGCCSPDKRLDTRTSFVVSQTSAVAAGPWLSRGGTTALQGSHPRCVVFFSQSKQEYFLEASKACKEK